MIQKIMSQMVETTRNILTDPQGRGTDTTETFTDVNTSIELSNKRLKNVYYIKNTTDGTNLYLFDDFKKNYDNPNDDSDYPSIVFREDQGGDDIEIKYHYGGTWVYPDYPQQDVTFPRVSIRQLSGLSLDKHVGREWDDSFQSDSSSDIIEFSVWVERGNAFSIDGEYYSGGKLKDYLSDQLVKTMETKRSEIAGKVIRDSDFNKLGQILHIRRDSIREVDIEQEEYMRKVIEFEVLSEMFF